MRSVYLLLLITSVLCHSLHYAPLTTAFPFYTRDVAVLSCSAAKKCTLFTSGVTKWIRAKHVGKYTNNSTHQFPRKLQGIFKPCKYVARLTGGLATVSNAVFVVEVENSTYTMRLYNGPELSNITLRHANGSVFDELEQVNEKNITREYQAFPSDLYIEALKSYNLTQNVDNWQVPVRGKILSHLVSEATTENAIKVLIAIGIIVLATLAIPGQHYPKAEIGRFVRFVRWFTVVPALLCFYPLFVHFTTVQVYLQAFVGVLVLLYNIHPPRSFIVLALVATCNLVVLSKHLNILVACAIMLAPYTAELVRQNILRKAMQVTTEQQPEMIKCTTMIHVERRVGDKLVLTPTKVKYYLPSPTKKSPIEFRQLSFEPETDN